MLLQIEEFLVGEELGFTGADEECRGLKAWQAVSDGFHAEGVVAEVCSGGHAEEAEAGCGRIGVTWRSQGPDILGIARMGLAYADVEASDEQVSQEGTVEEAVESRATV